MIKKLLLSVLLISGLSAFSQSSNAIENSFSNHHVGTYAVYGGVNSLFPGGIHIKATMLAEYYVSNNIALQYTRWFTEGMGLGTMGFNYYVDLRNEPTVRPYFGFYTGWWNSETFVFEFPVGVSFDLSSNIILRAGVKSILHPDSGYSNMMGEIMLGFRF